MSPVISDDVYGIFILIKLFGESGRDITIVVPVKIKYIAGFCGIVVYLCVLLLNVIFKLEIYVCVLVGKIILFSLKQGFCAGCVRKQEVVPID